MFLVDTNVLSERRRGPRANPGVVQFLDLPGEEIFLPVQVIGEILSGIEGLRFRGDMTQAKRLDAWFGLILEEYSMQILDFDLECAKVWGCLMRVNDQHVIDRQIASIALVHDLTVVTRNTDHFSGTGVRLLNPFLDPANPTESLAPRRPR
jgi:predicted nucleic acid-binding protein